MPEHTWTEADDQIIRAHYATEPVDVLAARLGVTRQQVYWRARKRLGLSKPHTSRFAPGVRPSNYKPIGSIRRSTRHDYLFIKVQDGGWPGAWRLLHHVVWEKENGPVPEGFVLAFKDHNSQNTALENLEVISKADWMSTRVHVEGRLPPEVAGIIRIKAALTRHINTARKEKNEQ